MRATAGFVSLGCLLGLALGMALRVDVVETFNDGFESALCAPLPDDSSVWQDGAGRVCVPQKGGNRNVRRTHRAALAHTV